MFREPNPNAPWRLLYAALRDKDYGAQFTYDELSRIGCADLRKRRGDVYRCSKEMQTNDQKMLVNISDVGYRIADPNDHPDEAAKRIKRARRQTVKARQVCTSANRPKMTPDAVKRLDDHELRLSRMEQAQRAQAARVEHVAKVATEAVTNTDALDLRVTRLEQALKTKTRAIHARANG